MNKFKLDLKNKTVPERLTLGATHITAMTGNANYPAATRVPTDAQVATAQSELAAAQAEVDSAEVIWKAKIQARDLKIAAWDTVITARAANCESVTPANPAALASTGFPLRSPRSPVGELPAPQNLTAKPRSDPGGMDLACRAVAGASSYEWECRVHEDAVPWSALKSSTTRSITVTGLNSGVIYAFRVRALGAAGPGPWSDEAVRRTL